MKNAFSSKKYIYFQKLKLLERIKKFEKLYLEIGGELLYDNHASRVLPGYKKTIKIELLKTIGNFEIIYCVNAQDLSSKKTLGKNLSYQKQVLKDLSDFKKFKIQVNLIVITRYQNQKKADEFKKTLEKLNKKVFLHREIKGYPHKNVIKGFSNQPFISTKKSLIILTGPSAGSGKMAVALSQIYHEVKQKNKCGFAKFETFPIHNLPISNPINIAYEVATADLQDKNLIDPYHKKFYKINSVNYNRDIENFKILKEILQKILKQKFPFEYKSPTDMGINEIKKGIVNLELCNKASIKEIKRRDKIYKKKFKEGKEKKQTLVRMDEILSKIFRQ